MNLYEKELAIPIKAGHKGLLSYFNEVFSRRLAPNEKPIRFAVTRMDETAYHCEVGIAASAEDDCSADNIPQLFEFRPRPLERCEAFNAVMIVPTGIGANIGGDSGDATPVARMLAAQCDNLILHPNVVNASDLAEFPENCLYVEGSVLTRLLMGSVGLQKIRANRVLLVVREHEDEYFTNSAINAASAARASMGIDCSVLKVESELLMLSAYSSSGRATGRVDGLDRLLTVLRPYLSDYDVVAISSLVDLPDINPWDYFRSKMVNPWGGVEALLTHAVSSMLNVQSAHSPMMESKKILGENIGIVDPCKAAEALSFTFLYCILKGLHKSPRIVSSPSLICLPGVISAADISCLVIPDGCLGLPTLAAIEQGIPIIVVRENRNMMRNDLSELPVPKNRLIFVENYLEAAGVMSTIKAGVLLESVRRPMIKTTIF